MLELLQQPFVQIGIMVSMVLAGIHAYLGFHVVSRGVIFVDLSLAQAAAFGYVVAIFAGVGDHSLQSYFISLSFTLLAALLVAVSRTRDDRIPQEAFIGIIYAGFAALAVLMLSHHPEGMETIQEISNGSILTCTIPELLTIAGLYSAVGLFHYLFREKFFMISENRQAAARSGMKVILWDFLFYATFGLVVTSSVHIAGVLLVFSLLVIPPVIALLFTQSKGKRLAIGWTVAVVGALVGIHTSLYFDLPTGPAIMAALILALVISAAGRFLLRRRH
ncbi:MAG: metal ABC transporter permease [candidate division Zixibacteria bacterium]|nr:metal ABC transporter permease [candidate division Zixibacteria bacterium]